VNFKTRKLTDLKVYTNNPRNNHDAVGKVKLSIQRYGYKVPIVIDNNDFIIAGHTRFAALLQINEETGNYGEIAVILADDLNENQVKQFRIVDNQVAAIADWDFTKLRIEIDEIQDFILDEFGDIKGFDIDLNIEEPDQEEETNKVKIQIAGEKIELTEAEYHSWATYVLEQKGLTVMQFVRQALELDPSNRQFPNLAL
jgi:ParB-like chromosome segregation protein Spo0J